MIHNYWDMKKYLLIGLSLGVTNFGWAQATAPIPTPAMSAGTDLPVSGWCVMGAKDLKFGPKEEGGKIIFTGEGFGAKGHYLAAFFPATEIGEGQTLKMRANVRFVGVANAGNFRYGLFRKRSRDHSLGWLGYCAYAGFNQFFPKGALLARFPGNDGDFSGMKDAKGQEAARNIGDSLTGIMTVKDGAYVVLFSLKKSGGAIEIESSMDGAGDVPTPMVRYSAKDSTPATSSFDALGFMTHEVLSTDSIEFSDISLKLQGP
jgi:hypothetical protein